MRKIVREVIYAGGLVFKRTFSAGRNHEKGEQRLSRRNPTPDKVREMNDRAAERRIAIWLAANFQDGDRHMVLTYAGDPPAEAEAKKHIDRFLADMRKLYAAAGLPFKYIRVSGFGRKSGRIHHHVIMNRGAGLEAVMAKWTHGRPKAVPLDTDGDYRALANYLINHSDDHFREPDAVFKRRFSKSKNIVTPPVYREEVEPDELLCPVPDPGYEIDEDSVFEGFNPFTGRIYIEYVEKPKRKGRKPRKKKRQTRARPRSLGHERWLRENDLEQVRWEI
jgi:hypothetical protein